MQKSVNIRIGITVFALVVVLILLGLLFSDIVTYIIISMVFATILRPVVNSISRIYLFGYRIPRSLAVLFSFVLVILAFSMFVYLFIPLVAEQVALISELDFNLILTFLAKPVSQIEVFLIRNNLVNQPPGFLMQLVRDNSIGLLQKIDFPAIFNTLIQFTGSIFILLLAVTFITFFFLYENGLLRRVILRLVPNAYFELSVTAFHEIEMLLSNYLLGIVMQMMSIFTIASIGLTLMGVKYAFTIAFFAAVANLIPYAGPALGATFGLFVGFSTASHLHTFPEYSWLFIKIAIVFGFVQLIDNLLLQPLIFSRSVKAHPLEIFVIIFVGATLAGAIGMVLAIPAYTVIRVSLKELKAGYQKFHIFKYNTP